MTRLTLATPDPLVDPATPVAAGLSSAEAQRRLTEFGPNEIRREQVTSGFALLVRQFASPVIWLLLVASAQSAALGEWLDAIAIGAIVIINGVIGFFQEHRGSVEASGTAQMNSGTMTMTGSYSGMHSCAGAFNNGQITMTRR